MTRGIKILALALASFAVLWTTSFAEQQDAATPAEEWTSSFAGQEPGELRVIEINGVSYRFRWAPPGTFKMGASEAEQEEELRDYKERATQYFNERKERGEEVSEKELDIQLQTASKSTTPQREVTLTRGFWILETEVTQPMWESIMGNNPSKFQGADLPVESVSWIDCQQFIFELNKLGVAPADSRFALPTEAQWEYACRAGTTTPFFWGDTLNGDKANCDGTHPYGTDEQGASLGRTTPVGSYAANPWGLVDMHGNVTEWCQDRADFRRGDYPTDAVTDPCGPDRGRDRVMRGGCWFFSADFCRSARRSDLNIGPRFDHVGFRFVLVPVVEEMLQREEIPAQTAATPPEEWTTSFDGKEAGDLRVIDVDGVSYSFRWAPPGTFTMGSSKKEQKEVVRPYKNRVIEELKKDLGAPANWKNVKWTVDFYRDVIRQSIAGETQRDVTLTQGFWTLETEVTQLMWERVMGYNPSELEGADLPVENITWDNCQEFVAKLNELGYAPVGARFALPTEAQWEYACRAGTTTAFSWGDTLTGDEANCPKVFPQRENGSSGLGRPAPVGSYAANPWGLFDTHGNVSEWCEDEPPAALVDLIDSSLEKSWFRIIRGGDWVGFDCRSARRSLAHTLMRTGTLGLRIVLVPLSE